MVGTHDEWDETTGEEVVEGEENRLPMRMRSRCCRYSDSLPCGDQCLEEVSDDEDVKPGISYQKYGVYNSRLDKESEHLERALRPMTLN